MPVGDYYIRVFVDGKAVPLPNHCGHAEGRDYKCLFRVSDSWGGAYVWWAGLAIMGRSYDYGRGLRLWAGLTVVGGVYDYRRDLITIMGVAYHYLRGLKLTGRDIGKTCNSYDRYIHKMVKSSYIAFEYLFRVNDVNKGRNDEQEMLHGVIHEWCFN